MRVQVCRTSNALVIDVPLLSIVPLRTVDAGVEVLNGAL